MKLGKVLLFILVTEALIAPMFLLTFPTTRDLMKNSIEANIITTNTQTPNQEPKASLESFIQFSGTYLFQIPAATTLNLTCISTIDFTRDTAGTAHERWNDLLFGNTGGNVLAQQGTSATDPFTNLGWGTQLLLDLSPESIVYVRAHRIATNEDKRNHLVVVTNSSVLLYTYLTSAESLYYFDSSSWTLVNNTPADGLLSGQTITTVVPADFVAPYIEGEYVIGTEQGMVLIENTENALITSFTETLVNNGTSPVRDLAVADWNQDGNLDIFVLYENSTINVYSGLSSSNYATWEGPYTINPGELFNVTQFELADLDNDGLLDVIEGCDNGYIKIQKNSGTGFVSANTKNTFGVSINDVKVADLDNDNDNDIVVALSNGSIAVLENHYYFNPVLSLSDVVDLWSNDPFAYSLFSDDANIKVPLKLLLIDFNHDGWIDIISAHEQGFVYGWKNLQQTLINPFTFGRRLEIPSASSDSSLFDVAFGDIDRDGDEDIVAAYNAGGSGTSAIYIYSNPGVKNLYQAQFTITRIYAATGDFRDIQLYDIDHDGDLDIIYSIYEVDGYIRIRALKNTFNRSSGVAFTDLIWSDQSFIMIELPTTSVSGPIQVRDITGDGAPDVIIQGENGNVSAYSLTSVDADPFVEANWETLYGGNIIINATSSVPITGLDIADEEAYWSSSMATAGYSFDIDIDDIVFGDYQGNVYYLPGQTSISSYKAAADPAYLPNSLIGQNSSQIINNIFYINDNYRRNYAVLVGGTTGDTLSEGFLGTYVKTSLSDVSSWSYQPRNLFNSPIYDIRKADLNLDGLDDIIFRDAYLNYYVAIGKSNGYLIDASSFDTQLILNATASDINMRPGGLFFTDLDGDGDKDAVILSTGNIIYYFKNSIRDDISTDFLTLTVDPQTSATTVTINVTVNGSKYIQQTPVLNITYEGESEYIPMSVVTEGKAYTYEYTLKGNGTYYVSTNATDQWENFVEVSTVFFGDFIPPGLSISVPEYANGSLEVFIYNTTEPIANNTIGMNLTAYDPYPVCIYYTSIDGTNMSSFEDDVLYYLGNNTWWIRITGLDMNTVYTIGVNATDKFLVNYMYEEATFINDIIDPTILFDLPVTLPTKSVTLDITNPVIPLYIEFSEYVTYLKIWVEQDGENCLYGNDTYIEEYNVGLNYSTEFMTTKTGVITIHYLLVDKAGNFNEETFSFNLNPFYIENVVYFVCSETGSRSTTIKPIVFVHFKGYGVYDFKITYIEPANNTENSTGWLSYDFKKEQFYSPDNPTLGYPLYFPEGDYGTYTIILSLRNAYEEVEMPALTIDYVSYVSSGVPWNMIFGIIGGVAGIMVGIVVVKKIIENRKWKQYLALEDVENL